MYECVLVYVCMHAYMYVYMYVCVYVCMSMYLYVYTCVCACIWSRAGRRAGANECSRLLRNTIGVVFGNGLWASDLRSDRFNTTTVVTVEVVRWAYRGGAVSTPGTTSRRRRSRRRRPGRRCAWTRA